ncbi:DUF3068 domain-containing protein [Corynebacterium pilosum]|uniref:Hypothetical membrane protein n=1 Tax=Corynebacterium pilosum TaxID=35756 RepID=A0A376CM78_9CORY|nr:DUF3068 domain-containing protein [Corynebacterium pilosum]STC69601.1 hypothetical membrane protein [Corynebacterium pilosum]
MLPKSRIFSALLVGLGVALIVAGLVAPRFLVGDGRMPLDMENTTYTLYDENGTVEGETTGVTRQLHMDIQNPANEDMVSLRVGETLFEGNDGTEFDALLSAQTWNWEMDRLTGEALSPVTLSTVMVVPPETVEMDGPWLKLPTDFDEETAEIFDPFLREAAPATYTGANEAGGEVNNYNQVVEPTNLATKYPAINNTKTVNDDEGNAEQLFLTYEADRILSYEANTGVLVGMHEDVDLYYADREGNRVEDYVSYAAATANDAARVDELSSIPSQATSRTITIVVIVLGAVLALVGLIGALRPDRRKAKN